MYAFVYSLERRNSGGSGDNDGAVRERGIAGFVCWTVVKYFLNRWSLDFDWLAMVEAMSEEKKVAQQRALLQKPVAYEGSSEC